MSHLWILVHVSLQPEWKIADPICTFLFSILVVFTTMHIVKDIMLVLMEGNYGYMNQIDHMHKKTKDLVFWICTHFPLILFSYYKRESVYVLKHCRSFWQSNIKFFEGIQFMKKINGQNKKTNKQTKNPDK